MARKPAPKASPPPQTVDRLASDKLLTEAEVRELLGGITKEQLAGMRNRREVSYVRMTSGCRYWRSSIVAWIEERTVNACDFT